MDRLPWPWERGGALSIEGSRTDGWRWAASRAVPGESEAHLRQAAHIESSGRYGTGAVELDEFVDGAVRCWHRTTERRARLFQGITLTHFAPAGGMP